MASKSTSSKPVTGPPQDLISRIDHLKNLIANLPPTLPDNPPHSLYNFGLDIEKLEEGGYFVAAAQTLEVAFGTWLIGANEVLLFTERGERLIALPKMMKVAVKHMSDSDRALFRELWIERLVKAAVASGAKIPPKKGAITAASKVAASSSEVSSSKRKAYGLPNDAPPVKQRIVEIEDADVDMSAPNNDDDLPPPAALFLQPALPKSSDSTVTVSSKSTSGSSSSSKNSSKPSPIMPDDAVIGNPNQQTLLSFFGKGSKEATSRYWGKVSEETAANDEQEKQAEEQRIQKQKEHARDLNTLAQRRRRAKIKAAKAAEASDEIDSDNNVNRVLMRGADAGAHSPHIEDIADVSRPSTSDWRKSRNGKKGGKVVGKSKRVFWFHPFLWALIEPAIRKRNWSAEKAVQDLRRSHPRLFDRDGSRLHRGTLWKWIIPHERRFTDVTMRKVATRRTLKGSGRLGALAPYPALADDICKALKGLRTAGLVVNVPIARSIMLAMIEDQQPDLLQNGFSCTEYFVRDFFASKLNWTSRKATRAAKKIPEDASEQCERAFFRLLYVKDREKVPDKLLLNYDQTGNNLLPPSSRTFEERGSEQVEVLAKDEKRAYTLGITTSLAGDILPFEQVWAGQRDSTIPNADADGYDEAMELGFHFTVAASKKNKTSHYSTLKTMKEWIRNIIKPYIDSVIDSDPDLDPDDQKAILYIDTYTVHIGQEFREFVFDEFPNIIVLYVPRNCTGIFQPQDVGIQRVAKHHLKQSLLNWLVRCHQAQIAGGITPEKVQFTSSLPVLRNASVRPCVDLYHWLRTPDGRDLIKKAWAKCEVPGKPEYNLSSECLSSRKSLKALNQYLKTDKVLADEIRARMGAVSYKAIPINSATLGIPDDGSPATDDEINADAQDDTDVPLSDVIKSAVNVAKTTSKGKYLGSSSKQKDGEEGLSAADDEENIWAYNDNGQKWSDVELPTEEDAGESEEELD